MFLQAVFHLHICDCHLLLLCFFALAVHGWPCTTTFTMYSYPPFDCSSVWACGETDLVDRNCFGSFRSDPKERPRTCGPRRQLSNAAPLSAIFSLPLRPLLTSKIFITHSFSSSSFPRPASAMRCMHFRDRWLVKCCRVINCHMTCAKYLVSSSHSVKTPHALVSTELAKAVAEALHTWHIMFVGTNPYALRRSPLPCTWRALCLCDSERFWSVLGKQG